MAYGGDDWDAMHNSIICNVCLILITSCTITIQWMLNFHIHGTAGFFFLLFMVYDLFCALPICNLLICSISLMLIICTITIWRVLNL